jgi:molybdopterin converting factor subunit 1
MTIRVKLFAVARERIGNDELLVDLPPNSNIADLKRVVAITSPTLATILPHALWAVNAEYATDTTPINEKSEIALIPPVSGG